MGASARFPAPLGRGVIRPAGSPTAVMGVINASPDSFSDGGRVVDAEEAVRLGRAMAEDGAALLDVGGESTRPGADPVAADEELRRVIPVVRALAERVGLPVSVDTTKAAVFDEAFRAGASMLNDVSALAGDPEMAAAVAKTDAAVALMHRRGNARTMTARAVYSDLAGEVAQELSEAVARAKAAGIDPARILLDPGIGFSKTAAQSFAALAALDAFRLGAFPLLVGPSRKSFLAAASGGARPEDRDAATLVVVADLARRGVEMVRVHDVRGAVRAITTVRALAAAGAAP